MKKFGYGLLALVVLVALVLGGYAARYLLAPVSGTVEKQETIQSGDYRIHSYNHFYDLCASIQRQQRSLQAQKELLDSATDSHDKQRVRTRIAALKAQVQNSVSQYNADSRKAGTLATFKADDLPYQINYQEEGVVTCR